MTEIPAMSLSIDSERTPRSWMGNLAGAAALVATLALTSPGIQIAQASDDGRPAAEAQQAVAQPVTQPREVVAAAPACEVAPAARELDDAFLHRQALLVEQEIARRVAGAPSGAQSTEHGVLLNGRGFNYGTPARQPGL